MDDIAVNEQRQRAYNAASDDSRLPKAFLCPVCHDIRFVRVEAAAMTRFFGVPIPCPHCSPDGYDRWVAKHGIPPGLPKWVDAR